MLKIQNLSVSYGSRRILHDISLDVQSGEVLALIGPNGAGKSTLIRAVSGVIPYAGHIRPNGDNFASLSTLQRARYIATVPQAVSLPPAYTVWETVLFGRTPHLCARAGRESRDEACARRAPSPRLYTLEAGQRPGEPWQYTSRAGWSRATQSHRRWCGPDRYKESRRSRRG